MTNKRRNNRPDKKAFKRRKGKGITYSNLTGNPRLLAIVAIGLFSIYIFNQFSLLFSDMSAITKFGWIVIGLLTFSLIGILIFRLRKTFQYLEKKKNYETSRFFIEKRLPYHKLIHEKGKFFEYTVSHTLEKAYPDSSQLIDITIRRKGSVNEYAQIDCILFHVTGIYVLELKDYNGYVYGARNNRYWNVGYETNGKKATYEIQNPILQNLSHIKDLSAIRKTDYKNFVLFSSNATIDTELPEVHTLSTLKAHIDSREPEYSMDVLKDIKGSIEGHKAKGKTTEHIKRIQFNKAKYT